MTSSTTELWVQAGARRLELTLEGGLTPEVPGVGGLRVVGSGLPPDRTLDVRVGERSFQASTDSAGGLVLTLSGVLQACAGLVRVQVGERWGTLSVIPTKIGQAALISLVEELEALAPGLAGDPAGLGATHHRKHTPSEATLALLHELEGSLSAHLAQIRAAPIAKERVLHRAVAASVTPRSPAELRWLARNPHRCVSARARGGQVGVRRERRLDLNTDENAGVLFVLQRVSRVCAELRALLEQELEQIEAGRPAREAFRTQRSNLYEEQDGPRVRALGRRLEQVEGITERMQRERARLGFGERVRPRPMRRSARLERHVGYWGVYQAHERLREIGAHRARTALLPMGNTDELYELWCTLVFVQALGFVLGRTLQPAVQTQGWFSTLPQGLLLEERLGDITLRVHREPAWDHESQPIARLRRGAPLRPDIVLELAHGEIPLALHVFDAKHSLPRAGEAAPWEAFERVWLKYGDALGRPDGSPLVESCWILFPEQGEVPALRTRSMLSELWPSERLRGGAIPLRPKGGNQALCRVLSVLLSDVLPAPRSPAL